MSREVRRVAAGWQHPKDSRGNFIPTMSEEMPKWLATEAGYFQMYESTSEGTPISPVMESPEALARWLADTHASAFSGRPASFEAWLNVCKGADAVTAVINTKTGTVKSGVEAGRP